MTATANHHWLPLPPGTFPTGVHAGFTLRAGGVSPPPFDSWNLGDHVGDQPDHVAANRRLLAQQLPGRPVFLKQVHGTNAVVLTDSIQDGEVADACWTQTPGLVCTIMVADCLPLLFCSADGRSVAAAHAGWRGLAGINGPGVIESLLNAWPAVQSTENRRGLRVWLGPCIGPSAFEVGPEVRDAFTRVDAQTGTHFKDLPQSPGKFLADLAGLARHQLSRLGVEHVWGNDSSPPWCTVSDASRFFSHRRDAARFGSTGRMAACIGLLGGAAGAV